MKEVPYTSFDMNQNEANDLPPFREKRSSLGVAVLRIALVLIIFALAFEVVYYFVFLPLTSNAKIIFNLKNASITEAEARAMTGLRGEMKWALIDSSKIANTMMTYPIVESAIVKKKFPDKVLIEITSRKAVAVSFAKVNGFTIPLEIDKEGFVFRMGWSSNTSLLTIVSGLNFTNPKVGMRLSRKLETFFSGLANIAKTQEVLLNNISEIKINEKKHGDYDLILYPTHKKIMVFANKDLSEKTLNKMILTLDALDEYNSLEDFEYVDIRGENIVYKMKERNLSE